MPRGVIGVDTSKLLVAKTGLRGANDLVWVGRAANYAAKLSALPHAYATYITLEVYSGMNDAGSAFQTGGPCGKQSYGTVSSYSRTIYRSNWWWQVA